MNYIMKKMAVEHNEPNNRFKSYVLPATIGLTGLGGIGLGYALLKKRVPPKPPSPPQPEFSEADAQLAKLMCDLNQIYKSMSK